MPDARAVAAGSPESVAHRVIAAAVARGLTLATAESLTGGAVAAALVDVPGASVAFRGGVVSYVHGVKTGLLGVDASLLRTRGAVDPEVARQMARGARTATGADVAVATTGVAGPEPHDGQPVGTVWIGVATATGETAQQRRFPGGRAEIRAAAREAALTALLDAVGDGDASDAGAAVGPRSSS